MAHVEVRDFVLWTKHIHGDDNLRRTLEALAPGETIVLVVDGQGGLWRKARANRTTGAGVPGLAPIGQAKIHWGTLFRDNKAKGGALVSLEIAQGTMLEGDLPLKQESGSWAPQGFSDRPQASLVGVPEATADLGWAPTAAEREAAWQAFKELWTAGWRSEKPYGPRDELYDRDDREVK